MIKERLLERLHAAGLTPRAASLRAELSSDAIRNILRNGSKSPQAKTVSQIAKVLGCRPAYLTGESDVIEPDGQDQQASTDTLKDTAAKAIRWFAERQGVQITEAQLAEAQVEYIRDRFGSSPSEQTTLPQIQPHPKKPK